MPLVPVASCETNHTGVCYDVFLVDRVTQARVWVDMCAMLMGVLLIIVYLKFILDIRRSKEFTDDRCPQQLELVRVDTAKSGAQPTLAK